MRTVQLHCRANLPPRLCHLTTTLFLGARYADGTGSYLSSTCLHRWRLQYPPRSDAVQLRQLVDCYSLLLHDSDTTRKLGWTLDVVITRDDVGRPQSVTVADVGLSDHHLLQWSVPTARSPPPVEVLQTRPRRKLNVDDLRAALSTSSMCRPDEWPADVDDMAALYDRQLTAVLNQLIPMRGVNSASATVRSLV